MGIEALISQDAVSLRENSHRSALAGRSTRSRINDLAVGHGPHLRYSSPRPWILGLSVSAALWTGIGWGIWKIIS